MWKVCFMLLIVETTAAFIEPDNVKVKCSECGPGFFVKKLCDGAQETDCEQCPDGFFTDSFNLLKECRKCSVCKETDFEFKLCHATHNVECKPCSSTTFTHSEAYKTKCRADRSLTDVGSGDNIKDIASPTVTKFTKLPKIVEIEEGSGIIMFESTSVRIEGRTETLSPLDASVDELLPLKPTDTTKLQSNQSGIIIQDQVDVKQGKVVHIDSDSEPGTVNVVGNTIIELDTNATHKTPSSQVNSPPFSENETGSVTQEDDKGMIVLIVIVLAVLAVSVIITVVVMRKKCKKKKFNIMRKSNGTNGFVKNGVQKDNGSHDEGVYDENDEKPVNGSYNPTHTPPLTKKEQIEELHAKPLKNSLKDPYLSRDSITFIDETDDEGMKASNTDRLLSAETSFSDHNDSGITDSTEGDGNNASKEDESTPMLAKVGEQKEKD